MKRILLLLVVFCLIASTLLLTNCTIYWEDGSPCRGFGYECAMFCGPQEGCGALCLDCLDPGGGYYDDHMGSIAIIGKEGVDYTKPTVELERIIGGYTAHLSLNILTEYPEPWQADIEIAYLQSGVLVGTTVFDGLEMENGEVRKDLAVSFNTFYNKEGGDVTCIINHFALTRTPS